MSVDRDVLFLFVVSFILVYVKHKERRFKNDFCCSSFSSFCLMYGQVDNDGEDRVSF